MAVLRNHVILNNLRIQIRAVSDWRRTADFQIKRHFLPCTSIWYVVAGTKKLVVDGQPIMAEQGDLIVLPPNTELQVTAQPSDQAFHYLSLTAQLKIGDFDLVRVHNFPMKQHITGETAHFKSFIRRWQRLVQLADQLSEMSGYESGNDFLNTKAETLLEQYQIMLAFHQWVHHLLKLYESQLSDASEVMDPRVMKIITHVKQHFDQKLDVDTLSAQVFISPGYLRALFRQHLQCSPASYVRQVRMQNARELLLSSTLTIREIALCCGFGDQCQFSKAFHKVEGMSPSQYRKEVSKQ